METTITGYTGVILGSKAIPLSWQQRISWGGRTGNAESFSNDPMK